MTKLERLKKEMDEARANAYGFYSSKNLIITRKGRKLRALYVVAYDAYFKELENTTKQ